MNRLLRILTLVVLAPMLVQESFACDPCALYSALNANKDQEGSFYLSVFDQATSFEKGNEDQYYSLKNGDRVKTYSTTQLNLSYGLTQNISLQVSVPFVTRTFDKVENFRSTSHTDSGLGDVNLIAQFSKSFSLEGEVRLIPAVYAGIKLPTGDTGTLGQEAESAHKHHVITGATGAGRILTFGSGSYDFPLGGSFTVVKNRVLLPAGAQYTIRTEGSFDYRFQNDLFWYANPGYFVVLNDNYSISVNAFLSGENKEADERNGQRVALSSFSNLFFGPSMSFSYGSNLTGEFAFQRRVTDKDNGIIVPEDRLRLALSYRF